jgi:hypothetical protein
MYAMRRTKKKALQSFLLMKSRERTSNGVVTDGDSEDLLEV